MASKYDDLDASTELEQQLSADLRAALSKRACEVVHNGANSGGSHSPGGKADIEIRDEANGRLVLVEVTRRKSSNADGEYIAVTDHLEKAVKAGGYTDYGVLYISPATSARLSANFRLWNRTRERDSKPGRIVALDFEAAEMLSTKLAAEPSELSPASGLGALLSRWEGATDDAQARLLVQQSIFPEDTKLGDELEQEAEEYAADRERRLKGQFEKIEDSLRGHGVTGDDANRVLIYLTFLRLYEERRQRLDPAKPNRFTLDGFRQWSEEQPATTKKDYKGRMVDALLREIAVDPDLVEASLLGADDGMKHGLHPRVHDSFVLDELLPVLDEYNFDAGRIDVLGAVFETLARRGEKDTRVGQFFTPQPVVDFCTDLVPIKSRDVLLDPAVGTARFLIQAMKVMLERANEGGESKKKATQAIKTERLLGTDISNWVATIAKMNMYIHGDGKTNIRVANGLVLGDLPIFAHRPDGIAQTIDVVLTNPPLGDTSHRIAADEWHTLAGPDSDHIDFLDRLGVVPMRVIEAQQLEAVERKVAESDAMIGRLEALLPDHDAKHRLVSARRTRASRETRAATLRASIAAGAVTRQASSTSMKGGALFLGAIANYLKPVRDPDQLPEWRGGWAAVVVDEAILNTPDYGPTREFIRDRFYVKAVVSLDRQAFKYLAHTDAKTSVVFLTRKPEAGSLQAEPIFYAHAERVGYSGNGDWVGDDLPQVKLNFDEMRDAVLANYEGGRLNAEAAQEAVESLSGFGETFYAMSDPGGAARLDFFNARYQQRTRELRAEFADPPSLGEFIAVAHVEHPNASRTGEYPLAEISRITGTVRPKGNQVVKYPPRKLWIVREGDLVVSGIDAVKGSVAVAGPDVDGMVMSDEMWAYRVIDPTRADPVYLALLLTAPAARDLLMGMVTGTSNRTRLEGPEHLLDLLIPPLPEIADQREIAEDFMRAVEERRAAELARREIATVVATVWPERNLMPAGEEPAIDEEELVPIGSRDHSQVARDGVREFTERFEE